jgi:peptide-methionine (R)-S-oxide reductase
MRAWKYLLLRLDKIGKWGAIMFSSDKRDNQNPGSPGRRVFLIASGLGAAGLGLSYFHKSAPVHVEAAAVELPTTVKIVEFTDAGQREDAVTVARIVKTDEAWRKQLTPDSFEVTRLSGTERPYTNEDPGNHEKGVFRCICCDIALFDSNTKFESGTGWPSFWAPIAKENVLETMDNSLFMVRTAVSCRLCDAHLGHVFDDGPDPTGLRYCMNSVAMRFAKAS